MKIAFVILGALLCLQANAQNASSDKSDEALVAAAEQLIAENATVSKAASMTEDAGDTSMEKAASESKTDAKAAKSEKDIPESEIPVVLSAKKASEEKGSSIWRMVGSLAVVAVTAALALYASKRWGRTKDKGGQKARIEMMHQFHMGPRKSVALIRVAGETMLIGVTDHNINMIKSVTLIDDELEHVPHKDFNSFLEDEFSIEDVRGALAPRV